MKSWWIKTEGGRVVLESRDVPVPQVKAGEVLVKVQATAMNRGELIAGVGLHAAGSTAIGGSEAAGEVAAVGQGVTAFKAGERVMGRSRSSFAEYVVMPAHQVMAVPAHLSMEQAAAVPIAYITAYDMLYTWGRLKAGETLLITGASSGVGVACIQIGKLIGATVVGTSGSASKLERLGTIGLDVGLQTRNADFAAGVRKATSGAGANLIINNVGGSVFPECIRALAYRGRLATVGYVDGVVKAELDLEALHANCLELFGVSNKKRTPEMRAATMQGFRRDLLPAVNDGRLIPVIDRTFGFDQIPAAAAYMDTNAHLGKIVVTL